MTSPETLFDLEDTVPKKSSRKASKKASRNAKATATKRKPKRREAAEARDISVAEFFEKNRHMLGFDSPTKAILMSVKEAVDNSLDACEEADILPELWVEIDPVKGKVYRMAVEDNGPGIADTQIGKIFGKLLYGSKFHKLSQSRGQQGIGISAAGMYGKLTTGKPVVTSNQATIWASLRHLGVDTSEVHHAGQLFQTAA